jgi:hypothetical protein
MFKNTIPYCGNGINISALIVLTIEVFQLFIPIILVRYTIYQGWWVFPTARIEIGQQDHAGGFLLEISERNFGHPLNRAIS